jgi:hypothetical protein
VTLTSFTEPAVSITSQPVTIHYFDGWTRRRYTPDFLVTGACRRTELIEIKYDADLRRNRARLEPAFHAAEAWALEHCGRFRVVTELEIRGPRLTNAQRLLPLRYAPIDPELAACVLAATRSQQSSTLGSVLATLPGDSISLSTLWRLLARGKLRADLSATISFDTPILAA